MHVPIHLKRSPETIEGMDPDEYIRQNADDIWLKQNHMYEILYERETIALAENNGVVADEESGF